MAAQRPDKTLVDYMAIAISPALIMVLVGSLAFFLLEVFYGGAYGARLTWIVGCFVFAAVLIARISMEEGAERATLYGACLAIAVAIATTPFVDHPLWVWLVLAVIWFCAHELTWNCTLIDETADSSGEGLLQAAGLTDEEGGKANDAAKPTDGSERKSRHSLSCETTATASDTPTAKPSANEHPAVTLGRRVVNWFIQRRKRNAPPGLWVVYFSLAALPIFGFGQLLLPPHDLIKRRSIYWLVFWYVASALGLLLTTSFLGLRRYLRQRKLQMPAEMAGTWLAVGGAMIVVMLVVAAIVPRPNPEYAISALSGSLGSPDLHASRYSPLPDSPAQDDEGQSLSQAPATEETPPEAADTARTDQPGSTESQAPHSQPDPQGEDKGAAGDAQGKSGGAAKAKESRGEASDAKAGEAKSGEASQRERDSADDKSQAEGSEQKDSGGERSADAGDSKDSGQGNSQTEQDRSDEKRQSSSGGKSPRGSTTTGRPAQIKQPARPWFAPPSAGWLLPILKGLLYLAIIAGGLYLLIRYWTQVQAWLARFWQELLDFWHGLFAGRRRTGIVETGEEQKPQPRPFAAFRDPFLTGESSRVPLEELVRYTFDAMEAWAAEHGLARSPDETPLEFAARLGEAVPAIAAEARELAGLYARVAYARQSMPDSCTGALRRCWQAMRSAAEPVASERG